MSNSFLTNLFGGNKASMTCKDMSMLFNKRHDSVKRTIRTLVNKGVIAQPQIVTMVNNANNRDYESELFLFKGDRGKRDSLVVAAQVSAEFTADIVDRWLFLESEVKSLTEQLEFIQNKENSDSEVGSFHGYGLNQRKQNKKENSDIEQGILCKMKPLLTNLTLH